MTDTPITAITLLDQTNTGQYLAVNAAVRQLELLAAGRIITRVAGGVPGSPVETGFYLVDVASGSWVGRTVGRDLAYYYSASWHFVIPLEGMMFYVLDEDVVITYSTGTTWSTTSPKLTATRVMYAGTDGYPTGSSTFTFASGTVTATNLTATSTLTGVTASISGTATAATLTATGAVNGASAAITNAITAANAQMTNGISVNGNTSYPISKHEKGTGTPELWDNTLATDPTPPTYSSAESSYTVESGGTCCYTCRVNTSALGTLTTTQTARIGPLPFALRAGVDMCLVQCTFSNFNLAAAATVFGIIYAGTSYITLQKSGMSATDNADVLISEFSADGFIRCSVVYPI